MKHVSIVALAVALIAAGCSKSSSPTNPTPTKPTFTADLRTSNEVPPIANAESSGTGSATITFDVTRDASNNVTAGTATFVANVSGFPAGTALNIMHIHEAPAGTNGNIVVQSGLTAGEVTLVNGAASITKSNIMLDPAVATRILNNPAGFYFNIHSTLNPGGVIRGQLVKIAG